LRGRDINCDIARAIGTPNRFFDPNPWKNYPLRRSYVLLLSAAPRASNHGRNFVKLPHSTRLYGPYRYGGSREGPLFLTLCQTYFVCRGAHKSLARPGKKQANVYVRMAWISFGALPCRGGKNLMTGRVSMLLKSRASLTCFRAFLLPGRAKDLSAPQYLFLHYFFCLVTAGLGAGEYLETIFNPGPINISNTPW